MATGGDFSAQALRQKFCTELEQVGALLERIPAKHRPGQRALAKAAGVTSPTTVGHWLKGSTFPSNIEALCAALDRIRGAAVEAGLAPQERELLDSRRWQEHHRKVLERQLWEAEQLRLGERAAARLEAEESAARWRALTDPPRAVRTWKAGQLRVHPAISGTRDAAPGFILPTYIPRAHDERLRDILRTAATSETPVLLMVRGGSCTGKTRAAVEALHAVEELADWNLAFPGTAASALQLLNAGVLDQRAVLWLDDAHQLLPGTEGEALVTALYSRLHRRSPAIILATMWTSAYSALTAPAPKTPLSEDPRHLARALLGEAFLVDVPPAFTADDLRAVDRVGDASLAAARRSGRDGKITQTLAAGLQLVDRYTSAVQPPYCYTRAVITAAMDATRLGWRSPLPEDFLREAAPGYLDDDQRAAADHDWFAQALDGARETVQHVAAALEPVPQPGGGIGRLPGVWRLTDYLDAHGRTNRAHLTPPPVFWAAAARHNTDQLAALARAAAARGQREAAECLYLEAAKGAERKARQADDGRQALLEAGRLREKAGDKAGAKRLFQESADGGWPWAWNALGEFWEEAGDRSKASALYARGFDAGDEWTFVPMARMREEEGRPDASEGLARLAAQLGNGWAVVAVAKVREQAGDQDGAERLCREVANSDYPWAFAQLAKVREQAGDQDGAERLCREAVNAGYPRAFYELAELREQAGDQDGAERLCREAVNAGYPRAFYELAELRELAGDQEGAERLDSMSLHT